MNKLFTLIVLTIFLSANISAQIKAGLQAGFTISKFTSTNHLGNTYLRSYTTSPYVSFTVGIVGEIELSNKISLQSGISIASKGSGLLTENYFFMNYRDIQVVYLQIPLNVIYKYYKDSKVCGFFGSGLYAAHGIWGVESGKEYGLNSGSSVIANKIIFSTNNPGQALPTNIKPFDIGFNLITGVTINKFEISASFSRGFSDVLSNAELYDGNYKNTTLSILLGYNFLLKRNHF